MGTATKHSVPRRVKPPFVIFDIRALWHSGLSVSVPWCLYLCGNSGCQRVNALAACVPYPGTTWFTLYCTTSTLFSGTYLSVTTKMLVKSQQLSNLVRWSIMACTQCPTRWLGSVAVGRWTRDREVAGSTPTAALFGQQPWASCSHLMCLCSPSSIIGTLRGPSC